MLRAFVFTLALLGALPSTAAAQVIALAASLLSKVEDVAAYPIFPVSMSKHTYLGVGAGMEFSVGVGSIQRDSEAKRAKWCEKRRARNLACDPAIKADTTESLVSFRRTQGVVDSTFTREITPLTEDLVSFSLTIASKSTRLESDTLFQGWKLGGRVQEYPTLTLYTAVLPAKNPSAYFGLTMAPTDLKNVRLTLDDSVSTTEASGVGFGGSVGVVALLWDVLQVFGEVDYSVASFQSLGWKRAGNLPANAAPTQLDVKGVRFSVGVQVPLQK